MREPDTSGRRYRFEFVEEPHIDASRRDGGGTPEENFILGNKGNRAMAERVKVKTDLRLPA